jgi:hypothetical protein
MSHSAEVDVVRVFPDREWLSTPGTHAVEAVLERGEVLAFPQLRFHLLEGEQQFLDDRWSDGKSKNISVRWGEKSRDGELRGASGSEAELAALRGMIVRYAEHAQALVGRLFPHYTANIRRGNTSFRPQAIQGRATSWRKDDTRLHVDAFPSNPTRGTRLLRVFTNLNPHGQPRVWRVGESFDAHAARFLPHIPRPVPGSAWWLHKLHVTKAERTEYDHVMLQLHDQGKADMHYQRTSPQQTVDLMPGTSWVVFSDQVLHAAMSGQHMMEQTFLLEPRHQLDPATSPLHRLERALGRPLAPH